MPAFYPLTAWLGARGLFVGLLLLWLLAILAVAGIERDQPEKRGPLRAVLVALFLGPVAFWMVDDLPYGFNLELIFFPLVVLFGVAVLRRRRSAVFWAVLLLLTREDGPVLAWGVHALCVWNGDAEPRQKRWRLLRLTLFWLALFGVELLVLRHNTPVGQPSRVGAALHAMTELGRAPGTLGTLAHSFVDTGVLLAAGLLMALFLVPPPRLLAGAVLAAPVLVTLVVASQPYAGLAVLERGPSWAPRFALLWGLLAVTCLMGIASAPPRVTRGRWLAALTVISLLAQYGALRWRRSYAIEDRLSWGRLARGEGSFASSLSARERDTLECLARRLPPETVVRTNHALFAIFERQDVVWPDHPAENTWSGGYAQVTICDVSGRTWPDGCVDWIRQLPVDGFALARVDGLEIAYGRGAAPAVEACGAGTRK